MTSDTAQPEHEREYGHVHDDPHGHERTRWSDNAHRADQTLWPDSVANPRRTRV